MVTGYQPPSPGGAPYAPGVPPAPAPRKKGMSKGLKTGLIIGAVILVLIIAGVVIAAVALVNFVTAPADVANSYVEAVNEGNLEEAWGYLTPSTQREETRSGFTEKLEPLEGEISSYNTRRIDIRTSGAYIVMDLTFTDGSRATWDMRLIKQSGDWKIAQVNPR